MKPEVETKAEVDLMLPEAMVGLCYCPPVKALQASWMRLHPFRSIPFVNANQHSAISAAQASRVQLLERGAQGRGGGWRALLAGLALLIATRSTLSNR